MIRILSLNVEGARHHDRVFPHIDSINPDYIALYEAPSLYIKRLTERGYFTSFAPMCTNNPVAPDDVIGILTATKSPHTATTHYYDSHFGSIRPHDKHDAYSKSYPVITTTFSPDGTATYTIAAIHLFDTWNGEASPAQDASVTELLAYLTTLPPHILCGDFNMPRGYNTNYERFTEHYADMIPATYASSLDRNLHRAGARTDLNAPIFDIYMVDYLFSESPYKVSDVRLEFGVSDHAAVIASITIT